MEANLFDPLLFLGKMLGLSRSVALVFAVLYSQDTPMTVEELVESTGLSKSAVSLALRDLLQIGAAQERMMLGARSRHYSGQPDLEAVAKDIMLRKLKYPLTELRDKLEGAAGSPVRSEQVRALLESIESALIRIENRA